ncbi:peptidyl-tRNA hydrolase [Candidatus Bathyarchaeota archaeon]|nr:peptidyl-tRNA hydrolase [Candidatus Bathyarchaeota archaeon]
MSETPFRYKQCIVLRADLGMSVGKLISQACHAAVESSEEAKRRKPRIWRRWRDEGAKKVVLRVESLEELMELAERAEELGIVNVIIRDRGLTEVPPGTITALGLGPDLSERMDRVTGHLKLFR